MQGPAGPACWPARLLVVVAIGAGVSTSGFALDPLEVAELKFVPGSTQQMEWIAGADAERFGVYRGRLRSGTPFSYSHHCIAASLDAASAVDARLPLPGEAFYYLAEASRRSAASGSLVFGGIDGPGATRDVGLLSCGERLHVDPAAPPGGDGLTWATAYITVQDALNHPHTRNRPFTIWIRDHAADPATIVMPEIGALFRGRFLGAELHPWDRLPSTPRTIWDVQVDFTTYGDYSRMQKYLFESIRFRQDVTLGGYLDGFGLVLEDALLESLAHVYVSTPSDYMTGIEIFVDRSVFDGSGSAIRLLSEGDVFRLEVQRSTFNRTSGAAIDLPFGSGLFDCVQHVRIVANRFSGGDTGIRIAGQAWDRAGEWFVGTIASNTITDMLSDGIELSCALSVPPPLADTSTCHMDLLIASNTIAANEGDGISCAAGAGSEYLPEQAAYCQPVVRDNILSQNGEYGYREGPDDGAERTYTDPLFFNNDIFRNGFGGYLDEGTTPYTTAAAVNALAECWDNVDPDPMLADPFGGDLHLMAASPMIDAASSEPAAITIDFEGDYRTLDGDGDTVPHRDIGADEH